MKKILLLLLSLFSINSAFAIDDIRKDITSIELKGEKIKKYDANDIVAICKMEAEGFDETNYDNYCVYIPDKITFKEYLDNLKEIIKDKLKHGGEDAIKNLKVKDVKNYIIKKNLDKVKVISADDYEKQKEKFEWQYELHNSLLCYYNSYFEGSIRFSYFDYIKWEGFYIDNLKLSLYPCYYRDADGYIYRDGYGPYLVDEGYGKKCSLFGTLEIGVRSVTYNQYRTGEIHYKVNAYGIDRPLTESNTKRIIEGNIMIVISLQDLPEDILMKYLQTSISKASQKLVCYINPTKVKKIKIDGKNIKVVNNEVKDSVKNSVEFYLQSGDKVVISLNKGVLYTQTGYGLIEEKRDNPLYNIKVLYKNFDEKSKIPYVVVSPLASIKKNKDMIKDIKSKYTIYDFQKGIYFIIYDAYPAKQISPEILKGIKMPSVKISYEKR